MPAKKIKYSPSTHRQYLTYHFVDKDPVIDILRTAIKDSGMSWKQVAGASGVSLRTLHNWFLYATRRPKFATINAVARTINLEFTLTNRRKLRVIK